MLHIVPPLLKVRFSDQQCQHHQEFVDFHMLCLWAQPTLRGSTLFPSKFIYGSPHHRYLRTWLHLGRRSLKTQLSENITMAGPSPIGLVSLYKEEIRTHAFTEGRTCEDKGKRQNVQAEERSLGRIQPADIVTLDFQPQELGGSTGLLFKCPVFVFCCGHPSKHTYEQLLS